MSYLRSNRRRTGRGRLYLALIVIVVGGLMLGVRLLAPGALSSVAQAAAQPVWYVTAKLGETSPQLGAYFISKHRLATENDELRRTIDRYEARMQIYDILARENARLHETLRRNQSGAATLTPAVVLVKPPQTPYDTLIVDVGRDGGVTEGDHVLVHDGIMIGRVTAVYRDTSRVEVVTSSGVETQAMLEDSQIHVTVSGHGGGNLTAQLPRDVDVESGDRILTRESPSRVIGVIQRIESSANDSFQTLRATTPVNISELRWVDIETEP